MAAAQVFRAGKGRGMRYKPSVAGHNRIDWFIEQAESWPEPGGYGGLAAIRGSAKSERACRG